LPGTSPERARELLSFCVVGAGPTGVELAAELHDLLEQDVSRLFSPELLKFVTISIIDLQDFILSSYDRRISEYATAFFRRQGISLLLGKVVKEVREGSLLIQDKTTKEETTIPFGLCVWATGIKLNPFASQLIAALPPGSQPNTRSLTVDSRLRVKGSNGTIYALGDAATIELRPAAPHAMRMLSKCLPPACEAGECLGRDALVGLLKENSAEFPHLLEASERAAEDVHWWETYANKESGTVGVPELQALLEAMDRGLRTLPATAQVAKQQGEFLASYMNKASAAAVLGMGPEELEFEYAHRGSLAYIGSDSAVADIPGIQILKGLLAGLVWKGFETVSQISLRNQVLVSGDLLRTKLFGRDLSRI
jgi:NADH:ubiquinone reductase (non-electrogenic)